MTSVSLRAIVASAAIALAGITTIAVPMAARADWDAAAEARDAARRQAAREAAAKQATEMQARKAAAQAEANKRQADDYRKRYRERSKGMSDEQVLTAGRQWDAESTAKAMRDTAEAIKHLPPEQRAMAEQMMKQAAQQSRQ